MSNRFSLLTVNALGVLLFVMSMLYPAGVTVFRSLRHDPSSAPVTIAPPVTTDDPGTSEVEPDLFAPARFGWRLFGFSVGLAVSAALVAVLLALPAAYVVGHLEDAPHDRRLIGVLLAPLLFPPMVYAFGWQRARQKPLRQ